MESRKGQKGTRIAQKEIKIIVSKKITGKIGKVKRRKSEKSLRIKEKGITTKKGVIIKTKKIIRIKSKAPKRGIIERKKKKDLVVIKIDSYDY